MSTEILIQEPDVVQVTVNESNVVVTPGYSSINVSIDESDPTVVTISNDQGPQGAKGNTGDTGPASTVAGPTGNGISNITRTSGNGAAGTTDTFTITYTNGSTTTFQVYNGTNGTNGRGITSIVRSSGNGTAGTTDTYTINYTDSTTSTFNVVNGTNGTNGQGVPAGGNDGQVLSKVGTGTGTDYQTAWSTPSATGVTSISAGTGLTTGGSPITSTGTIAIDTATTVDKTTTQTLTNKTLTSPVISTIKNTGTLTLPTATGTLALTSDDITGNAATATTAGNLSGTQTQKYVYAAPNAADGTASFRALVSSDIPTLNQNTTGTAANVTGTVAVGNGGTGRITVPVAVQWVTGTTYALGDLVYNLGVTYKRITASGVSTTAPASDTTNWSAQTAPATNAQTANTLALRDGSGNLNIGSGASIALGSGTSPSFGGGLSSGGSISINDGSLTTATTITGSGDVNAAASVLATNGNVSAGNDGATALPTISGVGNIRSVNQIITNSTASDSIKTSGGVTTGSVTASGNITAASATLTTGFGTNGIVHNNTSGVLSSSLIVNVDVSSSAAIAASKISGTAQTYSLDRNASLASAGYDIVDRKLLASTLALPNQLCRATYFTMPFDLSITKVIQMTSVVYSVASGTPTFYGGIASVNDANAPTSITPLAVGTFSNGASGNGFSSTASLSAQTNTATFSSITLTAGTTYAFFIYATNGATGFATNASVPAFTAGGFSYGLTPYLYGGSSALGNTYVPTVGTAIAVTNSFGNGMFGRVQ